MPETRDVPSEYLADVQNSVFYSFLLESFRGGALARRCHHSHRGLDGGKKQQVAKPKYQRNTKRRKIKKSGSRSESNYDLLRT